MNFCSLGFFFYYYHYFLMLRLFLRRASSRMNFCSMGKMFFYIAIVFQKRPRKSFCSMGGTCLLYISIIHSAGELTEEFLIYGKDVQITIVLQRRLRKIVCSLGKMFFHLFFIYLFFIIFFTLRLFVQESLRRIFALQGKYVFLHCYSSSEAPTGKFLLYGEKGVFFTLRALLKGLQKKIFAKDYFRHYDLFA